MFPPRCSRACLVAAVLLLSLASLGDGWRAFRYEDDRQWCHQVEDPLWPFAYSKYPRHTEELKVDPGISLDVCML